MNVARPDSDSTSATALRTPGPETKFATREVCLATATGLHICPRYYGWHCVLAVASDKPLQNLVLGICSISRTVSAANSIEDAALVLELVHFHKRRIG
jgi:hypothetical protein